MGNLGTELLLHYKTYMMKKTASTDQVAGKEEGKDIFYDHVTKEKIRKHLSDINDVITEDDIRNVKTDHTIIQDLEAQGEAKEKAEDLLEEQRKEEETEEGKGNSGPEIDNTSWNVLGR
jgi:hypothetical protein